MPFSDQPFRIPRYILARIAAEEYVRAFWWFVAIPPLFGLVCLFTGSQVLYGIGTLGILWPLTIPIRAVMISSGAGKFFSKPVTVVLRGETVYFYGEANKGMKLSLASVRKIEDRHGYILLIYGIGQFVAIPKEVAPSLNELVSIAEDARESREEEVERRDDTS